MATNRKQIQACFSVERDGNTFLNISCRRDEVKLKIPEMGIGTTGPLLATVMLFYSSLYDIAPIAKKIGIGQSQCRSQLIRLESKRTDRF